MVYAVIDTNVLVSALLTRNQDASTVQVVNLIFEGTILPLYNEEVLAEYNEVLKRKKFPFDLQLVNQIISFIQNHGLNTERTVYPEILPDEDDRVFYEITLSVKDSFLVTGNLKHYPHQPQVVTPNEMLAILNR